MSADLLVRGGVIWTMEPAQLQVEALAVSGGKITALGAASELEGLVGPDTEVLELAGRTLLPGFNDAHVHIWKKGHLLTTMLDLSDARSIGEIRDKVADRARALEPGVWLLGRGYNETRLVEKRRPTRADLDDVAPQNPICLTRTCAHIHSVNTLALKRAGITRETPDPPGGVIVRDAVGEPTGLLLESAYGLVQRHLPPFRQAELEQFICAGAQHLLSLGVTSATDPAVDGPLYEAYRALEARGALPLRANLLYIRRPDGGKDTLALPEKHLAHSLRCDSVKFFADGGLSGATAKLRQPYCNTPEPTDGVLRFEQQELYQLALEAHAAGFRIGTHAIGDMAIEQILRVYEAVSHRLPNTLRHRIEHFGLPTGAQLEWAAQLGVIAVPQTIFIRELGATFQRYLPEPYLARCYPVRAMLDAGLTVALSSDGPVVKDMHPLHAIHAAVTRELAEGGQLAAEQAIRVEEALYAYTVGGAVAQGDEDNRGSLSVGKWADMVVLSQDPCGCPHEALLDIEVEATYLAGEPVYAAP